MALLNYSVPYHHQPLMPALHHVAPQQFVPPPPLPVPLPRPQQQQHQQQHQQQQQQQQQQPQAYHYPRPHNPFIGEEQQRPPPPAATPHYTQVRGGGSKAQVHAVIDYDGDYYDDQGGGGAGGAAMQRPPVTPIQGPIYVKNGSVPVVPLYSYPQINNGSFVQIPILWTALSLALGVELRGEYIRGVPCVKKYQQLFCPTAGNTYPLDKIEYFIDENKALMKRMFGEFIMTPEYTTEYTTQEYTTKPAYTAYSDYGGGGGPYAGRKNKREVRPGVPDLHMPPGPDVEFGGGGGDRKKRQNLPLNMTTSETGRVDACESKVEIITPYWASNSAGKIRAIVNTQHFEQALHQEVCAKPLTSRCTGDCGCEQKYKWHRLLAYDPDNDCKGIFMDWFLFPSCCVCRCTPT